MKTILPLFCAVVIGGYPVNAQSVRGLVTDAQTGGPVRGAWLVVWADGVRVDSVQSGPTGLLELIVPTRVPLLVTVYHVAYEAAEMELTVAEASRPFLNIDLQPSVVRLNPIDVTVRGPLEVRHLRHIGFYDRRDQGYGTFLTREEIDDFSPQEVTDVLRHAASVIVTSNPFFGREGGVGRRDMRRFTVRITGGVGSIRSQVCPPLYFLDGVLLGSDEEVVVDEVLSVSDLEALEVHRGASIPAQFNVTGSSCGVLVFWTR